MPTAPEGAPESSFWAVRAGLLLLSSTGASLVSPVIVTAAPAVLAVLPAVSIRFVPVLTWAVFARISMKWREPPKPVAPKGWIGDAVALVGGLVLYAFLAYLFHPYVIGVPVLPARI